MAKAVLIAFSQWAPLPVNMTFYGEFNDELNPRFIHEADQAILFLLSNLQPYLQIPSFLISDLIRRKWEPA